MTPVNLRFGWPEDITQRCWCLLERDTGSVHVFVHNVLMLWTDAYAW